MTMTKHKFFSRSVISSTLLAISVGSGPAAAADIQLLAAAAMQSVFKEVVGDFERSSGHRLVIRYATMGAIHQRVLAGESADLIIGSGASISTLIRDGKIQGVMAICKTGIGAVMPAGTSNPPFRSVEDFKRALMRAKAIVYADPAGGGAAGIHIARVIEKLGLTEQLKPKTKFGAGGDITEVTLAQGTGALGMTQISEIVGKPTAQFVGPFPDELQNYTDVMAGIPFDGKEVEAVTAFLAFLHTPGVIDVIQSKGMEVE
jgi:molybdate transport system substrate-binding protein